MSEGATTPRVLMVDDQKEVADAYALRLEGVATVRVAYGGREALSAVDEELPDVVLLDRHMPALSGDEVLERLRERELRTRVVMVTAVDPGVGVLEMPFDDYLSKPVERADLQAVVEQQCRVLGYELLGEYFEHASKRAVLRSERAGDADAEGTEAEASDPLAAVERRASALRARINRVLPAAESVFETFEGVDREGY
jgi:DNA-binding response OmpR family regulator